MKTTKTTKTAATIYSVNHIGRTRDDGHGRSLQMVDFTIEDSNHWARGKRFQLVSFDGMAVEVHFQDMPSAPGILSHRGTIRAFAPGGGTLRSDLAEIWAAAQPSAKASRALAASLAA